MLPVLRGRISSAAQIRTGTTSAKASGQGPMKAIGRRMEQKVAGLAFSVVSSKFLRHMRAFLLSIVVGLKPDRGLSTEWAAEHLG